MFVHCLITFLVAMVPIVELRGAIPIGVGLGVPTAAAYVLAVIGNMIPVPFIYFFARKILRWGKDKRFIGKFCRFCLKKGAKGGKKLHAKAKGGVFLALFAFVAIPIPGTGAWTGTLAASILKLDFKKSIIAVILGVLVAGIIMGMISAGIFGLIRG